MGSSLDEFEVRLTFDSEGRVETTEYSDGAGCGHSREFDPYATTLHDVVMYHLKHYKFGHEMTPKRRCTFSLPHPGRDDVEYACNLEPHANDDHELILRRKKS